MSEKAAVWYKEADDQPALTGDIVIHLRVNIFDVEFHGNEQKYKIKFYLEAAWDDSSDSITPREDWDKLNPNKWDPRIFLPDKEGEFLHVERMWIAQKQYAEAEKFGTPMTAYRFIATAEFRAHTRSMENFPFDHHKITIVVRSREAEETKNKGRTVRFKHNEHSQSTLASAKKHLAYDAFDFAVDFAAKPSKEKTYLGVKIEEEPMGGIHKERERVCFKAVMRIRRRSWDWIIQAILPVLISAVVCGFSFMPAVCNLADRQQVSLGVLFTLVAFHLGLKSMHVYPKVPYIMFIDRVFLNNMLVMALCVVFNGVSYALHGTCMEHDDEYQTRAFWDWVLLGVICFVFLFSNVALFYSVLPGWLKNSVEVKDVKAGGGGNKLTSIHGSYRWPRHGVAPAS